MNILIITPYLADANNGNWRTARRWQQLLQPTHRVTVSDQLQSDTSISSRADVIIALHARRSHDAIRKAHAAYQRVPLIVVLTGTDLYRDLAESADARASLDMADALIVLQEDAIQYVPHAHRRKTHVVFQSAPPLKPARKSANYLGVVVVGHLRAEKAPETVFAAARQLAKTDNIHISHIGNALDDTVAAAAVALNLSHPHYHWCGAMPHGLTRAAIKRAHVLVHPSIMEGGANVIVEAITSGTPVLASRMSGNIGMLGEGYGGYFDVGDTKGLVALLKKLRAEPNTLLRLNTACKARAALFTPAEETRRLQKIVAAVVE